MPQGRTLHRGRWCERKRTHRRRSEEHTSELQSQSNLVCRLLLEKKTKTTHPYFLCLFLTRCCSPIYIRATPQAATSRDLRSCTCRPAWPGSIIPCATPTPAILSC